MSSLTDNENEFPNLNQANQISQSLVKNRRPRGDNFKILGILPDSRDQPTQKSSQGWSTQQSNKVNSRSSSTDRSVNRDVINLGISTNYLYHDLHGLIRRAEQDGASFVVTPIEQSVRNREFNALADFSLSCEDWSARVHIYLGDADLDSPDFSKAELFSRSFQHALYLKPQCILINCPKTNHGRLALASIINTYTQKAFGTKYDPFILFVVPLVDQDAKLEPDCSWVEEVLSKDEQDIQQCASLIQSASENLESSQSSNTSGRGSDENEKSQSPKTTANLEADAENQDVSEDSIWFHDSSLQEDSVISNQEYPSYWNQWNEFRAHLSPYKRMGICIDINSDPPSDSEEISRWAGEPIRMMIFHTEAFVYSSEAQYYRLSGRYKNFLKAVSLKNSFKNQTVLATRDLDRMKEFLDSFNHVINNLLLNHQDPLRDWNDYPQHPMQPLSSNLNSAVYSVFERDSIKYIKYKDAMVTALQFLTAKARESKRFVLMVLGAGRGPLVDNFIAAIKMLAFEHNHRFKIYALDKNYSSVRSLKYKQENMWNDPNFNIETEVVECDMRVWAPDEKADIIATELLGSLGDNELSPECIDGVWRFSTQNTISIPQSYASYVQPISSWRLRQVLSEHSDNPMEKIWVIRLNNYYAIDSCKKLFEFEHKDLTLRPEQRDNRRYSKLTFKTKIDTVCDGFAGYFNSDLFGKTSLSIMPDDKTPNMDSWFPAFIPLIDPINLPKDTEMEVHFWRKESDVRIWYEWAVVKPVRTKIHSMNGSGTAMSKFIQA